MAEFKPLDDRTLLAANRAVREAIKGLDNLDVAKSIDLNILAHIFNFQFGFVKGLTMEERVRRVREYIAGLEMKPYFGSNDADFDNYTKLFDAINFLKVGKLNESVLEIFGLILEHTPNKVKAEILTSLITYYINRTDASKETIVLMCSDLNDDGYRELFGMQVLSKDLATSIRIRRESKC